jgi:hypothetical protein
MSEQTTNLCDCERSANGLGMSGRKCDCPAGQAVKYEWIEPLNPKVRKSWWLTRRSADTAPGYDLGIPDIRVNYIWNGRDAWITGERKGLQRMEPVLSCLHGNNGWRIEGESAAHE